MKHSSDSRLFTSSFVRFSIEEAYKHL